MRGRTMRQFAGIGLRITRFCSVMVTLMLSPWIQAQSGGELQWVKTLGGNQGEYVTDVVCNTDGSIFVTGEFCGSCTFATGTTLNAVGQSDGFLACYNSAGTLQWARK